MEVVRVKKIALLAVGDSAWQGGIQYIINIINAINEFPNANEIEINLFKRQNQVFPDIDNFKNIRLQVHLVDNTFPPFTFINRVYWFLQRKLFRRINPQMENYFIRNNYDYVFPALLSDCGGRLNSGAWIADFQYHHFPDGHNHATNLQAAKTIGFIASHAKKIILSSKFCESDAYQLFPQTKCKSFVMPFAVYINQAHLNNDLLSLVESKYGIKEPYIMVSNLFAPTKNHKTLFEALGILRKRGVRVPCVCTGNFVTYSKMEYTNVILQMITNNGIRDQLYILGLIPREDQIALYRKAMALVQPSVSEGWSTLVEEAKALGKILVMSDIDVHLEQVLNNPFVFKSLDAEDLAHRLQVVYEMNWNKTFPELNEETNALINYLVNVREFGLKFLSISER